MADRREVVVEGSDIGTVIVKTGFNLARQHYVISLGWVLGLLLCALGNGYVPSQDALQTYESTLKSLPTKQLIDTRARMYQLEERYRGSRGWFFSCDETCTQNKKQYEKAALEYDKLEREYTEGVKDAKAALGLFSSYGTEEVRQMFWGTFSRGKEFAKRQTFWDVLFYGIGAMGRDEGMLEYALRVVINMLFNFTIGIIMSFISFVFGLWGVISSYRPDFLTGLFFFGLATVAAASFLVTWLLGLFAGTAGAVYVVGKVAIGNAIQDAERRRQQQYYVGGGQPGAGMYGAQRGGYGGTRPHRYD
eukprot:comp10017_c0_seq1/m.4884 comp10017_c0_seq1/g.4884  ORF comp10017_c0_seq1/g.4884 comp10017_c0_seq1/m.4884 type:complete len:305 (-) comp10017_c0_seq1:9-923(-)